MAFSDNFQQCIHWCGDGEEVENEENDGKNNGKSDDGDHEDSGVHINVKSDADDMALQLVTSRQTRICRLH
ncbi:hypothetical protein CFIMG_008513RA00001 [Ceratocystis fimbriata CBS 114723]|uniref:Uncharacterized protein n=1 Tax=Ceratocystis fimbriata CBS 114723 TaxID=1035309 RepID=A0A2C5XJS4_9PEZI|nr:hypothetical protein CFIMG_008513RA00001 [Ceratocystis fimbriata CBS 114723]